MSHEYVNEVLKIAAARSEIAGGILMPGTTLGALAAVLTGEKTEDQLSAQEKKGLSNFIPGVGAYRLTKRLMGPKKTKK